MSDLAKLIAHTIWANKEWITFVDVTLHAAHHRGQIATYVSKQGKPPINTDFIQYCLLHGV